MNILDFKIIKYIFLIQHLIMTVEIIIFHISIHCKYE